MMFDKRPRRHPVQTFQFWFCALVGFSLWSAWQFELISWPKAGSKLPVITEEPMPPPPDPLDDQKWSENSSSDQGRFSMAPSQFEEQRAFSRGEQKWIVEDVQPADETVTLISTNQLPPQNQTANMEISASGIQLVHATRPANAGELKTAQLESTSAPTQLEQEESGEVSSAAHHGSSEETLSDAQQATASADIEKIDVPDVSQLLAEGKDVVAHRVLSSWYWKNPEHRQLINNELNRLARKIYFQSNTHYMPACQVTAEEDLESIAARYQVPVDYMVKLNRLPAGQDVPVDTDLKVIQGPFSCVVDLNRRELTVHAHGYYVTRFPIAVGQNDTLETGKFIVGDKVIESEEPDESLSAEEVQAAQLLGKRWLLISDPDGALPEYAIHRAWSADIIGQAVPEGFVQLHESDVEELFDLLVDGSEVVIRR